MNFSMTILRAVVTAAASFGAGKLFDKAVKSLGK